jgi:hypothetical protein
MQFACAPRVLRVIIRLMQSDEDSHHRISKFQIILLSANFEISNHTAGWMLFLLES